MKQRSAYAKASPEGYRAMLGLEQHIRASGLEHSLLHLIKLRASQINGCAFCIDMHWIDARAAGEEERRLYSLDAWRESPFYTERERAALAWTEAVTLVSQTHVPDDVFDQARAQFSERELADLTWAVIAINGWNRFAVAFRAEPGQYKPGSIPITAPSSPSHSTSPTPR